MGWWSVEAFDDHGHALTAADAHGLHAVAGAGVLEAVEEGGHDAGAGHPERMAERDRATVDVQLLPRDPEVHCRRDHLCRERLVDLDEVDVVDGEPGPRHRLPARLD